MSSKRWWKVTDSGGLLMYAFAGSGAEAKELTAFSFLTAETASEQEAIQFFDERRQKTKESP